MTPSHCTESDIESVEQSLKHLDLPFSEQFARALVALLAGRKISLHHVAHLMPGEQDAEANRQQLRRCLDHESLTQEVWSGAISKLLPGGKWILALDRTEWRRGDTTINLLVLSVVTHGSAVPLLWTVLPSCGASDTAERIELLSRFVTSFGKDRLQFLTADREFIGRDWIGWLVEQELPFRIRIKANMYLRQGSGEEKYAWEWFEDEGCRCYPEPMQLGELPVYVGGKPLSTKDDKGRSQYLIVISNQRSTDLPGDYRLRWKIETLFQALKGRGFDLESCRLSQEKRVSMWFGFLSLGFCWCLKAGSYIDETRPMPLKKHGRRAVSVFQQGLRLLQQLLVHLAGRPDSEQLRRVLQELSPC